VFDVHHKPRRLTSFPSCHLSQVHKVQHKPTKKISWGTLQSLEQRQALVLPVAHRTVSGPQTEHLTNWLLSGFSGSRSTIIHRTVQWAYEATVNYAQWSTVVNSSAQCRSQKLELQSQNAPDCPVCHRSVRCRKRTKDFNGQPLQTTMVCWRGRHRTVNSVMSGAPPVCPVCHWQRRLE
jgi:hypothetical protein